MSNIEVTLIKNAIDLCGLDAVISMPNVSAETLSMVIEYCKQRINYDADMERLHGFYEEFMRLEQKIVFDLILAADYLEIDGLLELGCQTVANMMKGKTSEQIRQHFNIKNDINPNKANKMQRGGLFLPY